METIPKIIVVDDEKQICSNVEKILSKSNYEIIHALSAAEALEIMARESFSLLISDVVMPGKNGLELLKLVKEQWPLTKAVMMTAYASTDTAMKAIRLGALDYIPKPFTPDELRSTVQKALDGKLKEAPATEEEREFINVIDIDVPFDTEEVSKQIGDEYTNMMGRSDMPVVEVKMPEPLENYCELGNMVCDIFKKLGATCKAGTKTGECPQKKAKKRKGKKAKGFDGKKLIGIDMPFDYEEVAAVTGPEYLQSLEREGVAFVPYEELKKNVSQMLKDQTQEHDEQPATDSDNPDIEINALQDIENFCETGNMVCDIFKKLGATCKAGIKTGACPQKKAKKRKGKKVRGFDNKRLIAIDQPFDYKEVTALTGEDYVQNLYHEGTVMVPYEELKKNVKKLSRQIKRPSVSDKVRVFPAVQDQRHILVIDDEVSVNNNIRKILNKKGFDVDQAMTKDEAMDRISSQSYKLVLLDLKIPGVRGLELLRHIRDTQANARVIIITGYASIETAVETARLGVVDYLSKPFTPNEIRDAAGKALKLAA